MASSRNRSKTPPRNQANRGPGCAPKAKPIKKYKNKQSKGKPIQTNNNTKHKTQLFGFSGGSTFSHFSPISSSGPATREKAGLHREDVAAIGFHLIARIIRLDQIPDWTRSSIPQGVSEAGSRKPQSPPYVRRVRVLCSCLLRIPDAQRLLIQSKVQNLGPFLSPCPYRVQA